MIQAAVGLKDRTASAEAILKRYNSYNRSHPTYRAWSKPARPRKPSSCVSIWHPARCSMKSTMGSRSWRTERDEPPYLLWAAREFTTNSREEQEIRVLSLQLLQNCLMLINTILVERTVEQQKLWPRLKREDFRGLTPLFYNHINPYGTFSLDLTRRSFLDVA